MALYMTVHPHACGERNHVSLRVEAENGSSPRLWGTGYQLVIGIKPFRFIPTPVGNGLPALGEKKPKTVHPHACGERW